MRKTMTTQELPVIPLSVMAIRKNCAGRDGILPASGLPGHPVTTRPGRPAFPSMPILFHAAAGVGCGHPDRRTKRKCDHEATVKPPASPHMFSSSGPSARAAVRFGWRPTGHPDTATKRSHATPGAELPEKNSL